MAAHNYAYVATYGKPRQLQSEGVIQFDAGVNVFLYEGNFDIKILASIVTPLANGELVAFPKLDEAPLESMHWRGTAARV